MSEVEHELPEINPYASPKTVPVDLVINTDDDAPTAELRAFVGRKADHYLKKWVPVFKSAHNRAGFSVAGFFLSGLWLGYRKMYTAAAVFYGVLLGVTFLTSAMAASGSGQATEGAIDRVVGIGAALICGFGGNGWYLAHTKRSIAAARAEGLEGEALLHVLAARGGTSLLASLGLFALYCLAIFVIAVVLELVAPGTIA